MVIVNGFPKTGTHAAVKACELLGVPAAMCHVPYGECLPEHGRRVHIKRDPRNALISHMRMDGEAITQGTIIARLRSLPQALAKYLGWLTDRAALVISFEALIADDAEMRRLAKYLGVPYLDDAFPNLPGLTSTWTGEYSDWTKHWTPAIETAWQEVGGPQVLKDWGY